MNKNKFRGKRIDNGRWEFGNVINCASGEKTYIFPIDSYANESLKIGEEGCLRLVTMEVDPETVGQYTSLKDKNGKEIYEGDAIKIDHPFHPIRIVFFDNCSFKTRIPGLNDGVFLLNLYDSNVELIGNIHDNPELLGVESDE